MLKLSGLLFFLSGTTIFLGILTAEIFYPNYSISLNMISSLGATPPPDSVIKEPSAYIFDSVMALAGVLTVAGALFSRKTNKNLLTIFLLLLGIGTLGVGIFPAFHKIFHPISALTAFLSGGVAAILSSKKTSSPFKYIALILGIIALVFLVLGLFFPHSFISTLGRGGVERWVAYPIIIWMIGFGAYLMAQDKK